ncbi:mechanosensitive ion channel family protein [Clostridium sp. SYSU_GA19001]|uniref:mechanosensitive ion channel family protein n=1 Tax=Clostridium caldaquaticum TaxID=2940653 RepID=UPI0020775AE5|nr:mechanosensitive ion channel family protein [Clostridium caldaquaticum]
MKDIFAFKLDLNSGGINIGNIPITTEQITHGIFKVLKILSIAVIMYLAIKIGSTIIHKFMDKQRKSDLKFTLDEKRSKTLEAVLKSVLRYSVYFFGIVGIIGQIFGDIGLTFAGIGGVAIGFGAQSLVKDIINGFFILFEDQYAVGDYITVDGKEGIVESIELRVTRLRDFNGDYHIIPNGLITKVTNHSRGNARVLVEVDIAYEEDVDKAIDVLSNVCSKFISENENMVEGPKVAGISALKDSGITIRIVGKAKPMTHWECEMNLRKEIKKALSLANIEIPYPKRVIMKERE